MEDRILKMLDIGITTLLKGGTLDESPDPIRKAPDFAEAQNAIATLLSFMKEDNIVAVGSSLVGGFLTLYISSTLECTTSIELYVYEAWSILRDIFEERYEASKADEQESSLKERECALKRLVFQRSLGSIGSAALDEFGGLCTFFCEALEKYMRPTIQGHDHYILETEQIFLMSLQFLALGIYGYVRGYLEEEDETGFDKLYLLLDMTCLSFGNDLFDTKDNCFLNRCQNIYRIVNPGARPNAFRKFWDDIFRLHRSLNFLLDLPFRKKAVYFRSLPNVEVIPAPEFRVAYDLTGNSNTNDALPFEIPKNFDGDVALHCECTLLYYFFLKKLPVYGHIGLSNPPCRACATYFTAYNAVAERRELPKLFLPGTPSGISHPWVKPVLGKKRLDKEIEETLRDLLISRVFPGSNTPQKKRSPAPLRKEN